MQHFSHSLLAIAFANQTIGVFLSKCPLAQAQDASPFALTHVINLCNAVNPSSLALIPGNQAVTVVVGSHSGNIYFKQVKPEMTITVREDANVINQDQEWATGHPDVAHSGVVAFCEIKSVEAVTVSIDQAGEVKVWFINQS